MIARRPTTRAAFAVLLIGACALSNAASIQTQAGFQGVPWGASVDAIRARFPATQPVECAANMKDALVARGLACSLLQVADYRVADMPFELTFYLDKRSYTMREIGMLSSVDMRHAGADPGAQALASCDRLQELLSTKYGLPRVKQAVHDTTEIARETYWGATDGAATRVMLRCYFHAGLPTLELAIGYQPGAAAAADKL